MRTSSFAYWLIVWAVCFSATVLVHSMTMARVHLTTVSKWSLHSRESQTTGNGRTAPSPTSVISSGILLSCIVYHDEAAIECARTPQCKDIAMVTHLSVDLSAHLSLGHRSDQASCLFDCPSTWHGLAHNDNALPGTKYDRNTQCRFQFKSDGNYKFCSRSSFGVRVRKDKTK